MTSSGHGGRECRTGRGQAPVRQGAIREHTGTYVTEEPHDRTERVTDQGQCSVHRGSLPRLIAGGAVLPLLLLAGLLVPDGLSAQSEPAPTASVGGLLDRARSLAARGDAEGAVKALQEAISIAPNSEEVLDAYARFSLGRGNPIQAILALEPLARMHPKETEYTYLLGVARMQVGEMSAAAEALRMAAALDPTRALTRIALGLALNKEKRYAEAQETLAAALRLAPGNVEALAAMSEAAHGLGRLEEAARFAEDALDIHPDHPTALVTVGMTRLKEGRFEEARQALVRAVAAETDSIRGHYQLSLALARLGDREGSERHLRLSREAQAAIEERIQRLRTMPALGSRAASRTEP